MPAPGRRAVSRARNRRHDVMAILVVWAASIWLSLFVTPHTGYESIAELLYYTVYNVAIGAFVGFYLFDRLPKQGFALFAAGTSSAILMGTLLNEAIVEPFVFGTGPMNGEGVYYGITDVLWATVVFLLLRFAQRQESQRHSRSRPDASSRANAGAAPCQSAGGEAA